MDRAMTICEQGDNAREWGDETKELEHGEVLERETEREGEKELS